MVPGGRGVGRQEVDVRLVDAEAGVAGDEVEVGRDQDHAVQRDVVLRQQHEADAAGPHAAVALAEDELGRRPAAVLREVLHDEVRDRGDVLVDAPELLAVGLADRAREAGADRVDHHEVGPVEDAELVVDRAERAARVALDVGQHGALRAEDAHVQPGRRRAGPAVVGEQDRPRARIAAVLGVGREAEERDRLVLVVLHQHRARRRGVGETARRRSGSGAG